MKKRIENLFLSTLILWNIGLSAQHSTMQSSTDKYENGLLSTEKQKEFQKDSPNMARYILKLVPINSDFSDFGATIYKEQLIFTSSRKRSVFFQRIDPETKEFFTSLYSSFIGTADELERPKLFAKELQTKFNLSTAVFTKDNKTIYFTRNTKRNNYDKTVLKIYKASLSKGKWKNITELPFNSDQYSTAHPALSSGNDWLYFASDREGGFGNSDLFRVAIHADGTYGVPINLGEQINTKGRESFPFITPEDELYFATDGFPGLGGLDVFGTKINSDGTFSKVQNLGPTINSSLDDFSFYINPKTRLGFISSNRSGNDEIYSFIEEKSIKLECTQTIEGVVTEKSTGIKLRNAIVSIQELESKRTMTVLTDCSGYFKSNDLYCGLKYSVNVRKENYSTVEVVLFLSKITSSTTMDFVLDKRGAK